MDTQVESVDLQLALLLREGPLLLVLSQLSVVSLLVFTGHRFERGFQFLSERLPLLIDSLLLPITSDNGVLLLQDLLELGDEEIISLHRLFRLPVLIILTFRCRLVLIIQGFGATLAFISSLALVWSILG